MDPASAFGLAASVVQFVSFTSDLVSATYTIHQSASGTTPAHTQLHTITTSLVSLNEDLHQSLLQRPDNQSPSRRDQEIDKLCLDCTALSDELLAILEKLQLQNKEHVWSSFKAVLRMMWSQDYLDRIQKRLDSFRQQISMQILVGLRYSVILSSLFSLQNLTCAESKSRLIAQILFKQLKN